MADYLIGTGGWAYFHVPGLRSLTAYSKLFNFVEVNSTFYQVPNQKTVESWRHQVQPDFEFSVRCNKDVTHTCQFQPTEQAFKTLADMVTVCKTLNAEILHTQTPTSFQPTKENARLLDSFISSINMEDVRIALEIRGNNQALSTDFVQTMQKHNMIHSIDLSNDEEPAYKSDILYTRLFGKGVHNIYQPTDQELAKIDKRTSTGTHKKALVSFHFVRMYQDARRLKQYRETGKFPPITRSTGLDSLFAVMKEDAQFPSSKQKLIKHQGWKLYDATKEERIQASETLKKLPEENYENLNDVIAALRKLEQSSTSLLDQFPANHSTHNLISSTRRNRLQRITQITHQLKLRQRTRSTMNLNSTQSILPRNLTRKRLSRRNLLSNVPTGLPLIQQPRRTISQQHRSLSLHIHVSKHELNSLKLSNRLAVQLLILSILKRYLISHLSYAQRHACITRSADF